uniref:Aldose reductase-like n=1 Tax=Saccoglossus kowalevskii TaxID=10224 RepID=A0ABM0MQW0_SACKO|nr:PREDICTED: aldose reductase-like [Saccoglossus kowalevskii]
MAESVPTLTLNNGYQMPQLGLGTWRAKPNEVGAAVKQAIDLGYRHIDTAWVYGNEREIGDALKDVLSDGKVKREELYIVTKLWATFMAPECVRSGFMESLNNLQLDYVDLYLIHMPQALKSGASKSEVMKNDKGEELSDDVDYVDTWQEVEKLVDDGLAKSIGVSNFNHKQIDRILRIAKHRPVTNQIEVHPYLTRTKLLEWCQSYEIIVTAYSPLCCRGRPWAKAVEPDITRDPLLLSIAERHGKTCAQVALRFAIQRGCSVITKSVHRDRLQENIDVSGSHDNTH